MPKCFCGNQDCIERFLCDRALASNCNGPGTRREFDPWLGGDLFDKVPKLIARNPLSPRMTTPTLCNLHGGRSRVRGAA